MRVYEKDGQIPATTMLRGTRRLDTPSIARLEFMILDRESATRMMSFKLMINYTLRYLP